MKRTLQLTSPTTKGKDVEYAQRLLKNGGVWDANWYTDVVDGEFGQKSALAAKQAKYDLGYPMSGVKGTFGTKLEKFINGQAKLPLLYRKRRNDRLKQDLGAKALAEAKKWIGTKENPAGTNIAKPFTTWYGWIGWGAPWCAVFVSYCLDKAGFKNIDPKSQRWAYCPYVVAAAKSNSHGLKVVSWENVRPGDIALFDWDRDGVADHIGFVDQKLSSTTFSSVEGNTSPTDYSNGGQVYHYQGSQARRASQVQVFVRAAN